MREEWCDNYRTNIRGSDGGDGGAFPVVWGYDEQMYSLKLWATREVQNTRS